MRVTFRPAIAADFVALIGRGPAWRCQCITAELEGRVVAIGGFTFAPNGDVWASMVMADELRGYRAAVHRAGLMGMRLARRRGFRKIFASAQPDNPAAERWLLRFGFRPTEILGTKVFVWERDAGCGMTDIARMG